MRKVLDWTFWSVLVLATIATVVYIAAYFYVAFWWDFL